MTKLGYGTQGHNHRDKKSLVTGTRKEAGVRSTGKSEAESLAQVPPERASS